eukprot:TRINITY_DN7921_c0_g1_i1.p1 TRINITY_DN7921_c0_g1~~TRINITY_DN7921_c0_g1_i1.p1  ORF type:complete len:497 (-),score=122.81 TRINITY_DN7921_c0_g1_i1:155-1645(-)
MGRNSTESSKESTYLLIKDEDASKGMNLNEENEKNKDELMDKVPLGRFHFWMLLLCGLGWMQDGFWMRSIGNAMSVLETEFQISPYWEGSIPGVFFSGMGIGSFFWGWFSDRVGRKEAFYLTLWTATLGGIGIILSFHKSLFFITLFVIGFGSGGNLAVDGSIFAEFMPRKSRGFMMVMLSIWWAIGTILASLFCYLLLPHFVQDGHPGVGWRIFLGIPSLISFVAGLLRFLFFIESPAILLIQGKEEQSLENLRKISKWNGTSPPISTLNELRAYRPLIPPTKPSKNPLPQIYKLFEKGLGSTTTLIWLFWFFSNVGFTGFNIFLPRLLNKKFGEGLKQSFLYTLIGNTASIPGTLIGAYLVDTKLGRKWTMVLSAILSAILIFLLNYIDLLDSVLNYSDAIFITCVCGISFTSQIMYGAYYTYTPEVFPSHCRATGMGTASLFGKVAGIITPFFIGAILANNHTIPIYIDSGTIALSALFMALLPIETRGRPLE